MKVNIEEIKIGERRREEMGDLQGLADSIAQYGLLHPIVIDKGNNLVAGGRRLAACKLLGWQMIECTSLGELPENVRKEIELEENLKRKDLTEFEKSKTIVELAEVKSEILIEQQKTMATPAIVSGSRGPEKKLDSTRTIANELGIPRKTLADAQQHVQAVEKYPELEPIPKMEAIKTAKKLDQIPEPERSAAIQVVIESRNQEAVKTENPNQEKERLIKAERFKKGVEKLIRLLNGLANKPMSTYFDGVDYVEAAFNSAPIFLEAELKSIDRAIQWLQEFRNEYVKRFSQQTPTNTSLRRVK